MGSWHLQLASTGLYQEALSGEIYTFSSEIYEVSGEIHKSIRWPVSSHIATDSSVVGTETAFTFSRSYMYVMYKQ